MREEHLKIELSEALSKNTRNNSGIWFEIPRVIMVSEQNFRMVVEKGPNFDEEGY